MTIFTTIITLFWWQTVTSQHLDINDIIYHCEWEKEMDLKVDFSKPGAISLDFICLATCLKSPSLQDTGWDGLPRFTFQFYFQRVWELKIEIEKQKLFSFLASAGIRRLAAVWAVITVMPGLYWGHGAALIWHLSIISHWDNRGMQGHGLHLDTSMLNKNQTWIIFHFKNFNDAELHWQMMKEWRWENFWLLFEIFIAHDHWSALDHHRHKNKY